MFVTLRLRFFTVHIEKEDDGHDKPPRTTRRARGLFPGSSDSYMEEQRIYIALDSYDSLQAKDLTKRRSTDVWTDYFDRFTITTWADDGAYDDMYDLEKERLNRRDYFDRSRYVRGRELRDNPFIEGGQAVGYHTFQLEVFRALHNWCRGWTSVFKEVDKYTRVGVSSCFLHKYCTYNSWVTRLL